MTPSRAAAAGPVLLTGFEPFGGATQNPSWLVAQALHGHRIGNVAVHALQLPCVFGRRRGGALQVLGAAVRRLQPGLVLALGQAGGRAELTPERVAINLDDAPLADNAGEQPLDRPVVARGPAAYFSTLPLKAMVAAMHAAGVPAALSHTAGTFVCNHVFYGLMHRLRGQTAVRGGFMHLPWLPEQAGPGEPSLPLAQQVAGVRAALEAALAQRRDLALRGGRVS